MSNRQVVRDVCTLGWYGGPLDRRGVNQGVLFFYLAYADIAIETVSAIRRMVVNILQVSNDSAVVPVCSGSADAAVVRSAEPGTFN